VNLKLERTGVPHTDYSEIILAIYLSPVTLQSDFARAYPQQIAALASDGLITTYEFNNTYGRTWRLTKEGIEYLYETSQ
jgi:hypothetical protein